jgi:hypothetical protein
MVAIVDQFMFLLLVPVLGYGWGYRGWGRRTRGISSDVADCSQLEQAVPRRLTITLGAE